MVDPVTLIATVSAAVSALANSVSAAAEAKPGCWDSLTSKVFSIKNSKETLDVLNEIIGRLCSIQIDYQNKVERHKVKAPSETYKNWSHRVTTIKMHMENLKSKHDKQNGNSSSDFNKELKHTLEEVAKLIEESNNIENKLLVQWPLEPVVKMRAPNIAKYETQQKLLDRILRLLERQEVNGIRVHGTAGIGKTTIMMNLNNHDKITKMFDVIIWMKVSQEGSKENLSKEHLQRIILRRLKVNLKGNKSSEDIAGRISKELEGKKYMLLLDDVKEDLNLYDIGIPSEKKGSKIVLTTRQGHLCSSLVNMTVKVTCLPTDEAWEMFKDNLQRPTFVENPKIGPLAWRLCNECGGLPLLIEKVASTFKVKNDECLWSDGLNSWRIWPKKECQGIIELYNFFKICFDDLDDAQKQCFLYAALYPEDYDIYTDYLLERWKAEDFLENGCDTKGNQAVNGSLILSHLKNVSLLEESKCNKYVTMHKFIRQVALYISSNDPICMYLVKTNGALQEPMDAESWSQKRFVSLSDNDFNQLPDCPKGSKLSTLFLQKNLGLKTLPALFFDHMVNLRVLDVCETGIATLPKSLAMLRSLKVLCLSDCISLTEFPSFMVRLLNLEVLDIRGSCIPGIPTHLEEMKGLRHLRISLPKYGNENVNVNDFKIISKLTKLEELVIDMQSIEQWTNKAVVMGTLQNVAMLENFTTLRFSCSDQVVDVIEVAPTSFRVHVPDAESLQTLIEGSCLYEKVKRLKVFQIFISCDNLETHRIPYFFMYQRYVKYINGEDNDPSLPEVLAKPDAFEIVNYKKIKQLSDFKAANMNQIRTLLVESCEEIETIIGMVDRIMLTNIEHLYIKSLSKLESIWKKPVQLLCLAKLKTLFLSGCPKLIQIFPPGVVQRLREMQHIEIEDCSEVIKIFEESETIGHRSVLPKLKKLKLLHMRKLQFICENNSLHWPSLEELKVYKCPSMLSVPITQGHNAPKLKVIDLSELH